MIANTANPSRSIPSVREPRKISPIGLPLLGLALFCVAGTFLIIAGYTPIVPDDVVVSRLFLGNLVIIAALFAVICMELFHLWQQWRMQEAGVGLHLRIILLFFILAAVPAILMAVISALTLERVLNPVYQEDLHNVILDTRGAARLFTEAECGSLLRESKLTAIDLDRGAGLFNSDRNIFHDRFVERAHFLGFTTAALIKPSGEIVERGELEDASPLITPDPQDFEDARKAESSCLILNRGPTYVALMAMNSFPDTFLYTARPVNPLSISFPRNAGDLVNFYEELIKEKANIEAVFAMTFVLWGLVILLTATWAGLAFANALVIPIRRLIVATDQVASGNLYVQVPIKRTEGDLAHLGATFNKMTTELRLQQNRLVSASQTMNERRAFTEAVLSGVPAAVIGIDGMNVINVVNLTAARLLQTDSTQELQEFSRIDDFLPELSQLLQTSIATGGRSVQGQVNLSRQGAERIFNVRITSADSGTADRVITLDDITELVSAQRTSAWADVARRIAHEIKNPLTPIQLSAERLKRKYGRLITQDRDIFDQCTDTIVRQVDDIKRMVDEFSAFARMPKPKLEQEDLVDCLRKVVFLMQNGNSDIHFTQEVPDHSVLINFDRRLISQALTNIIKNAAEGIATVRQNAKADFHGKIVVKVREDLADFIRLDICDNGIGFPKENRQKLLEPYVTTRSEGTGLGLPIVAKILEEHGGVLELLDGPGGGACVALYFPRTKPNELVERQLPSTNAINPGK